MLTERRIAILKAIVDEFIQTAQPVGSKALMEKYELPYSSATIRNDMQWLEENGYLEKTHTSSGRIPSTQGYKYYCENLMTPVKRDQKMELVLDQLFSERHLDLEDAIHESCKILSQMTNLTSGALGPEADTQALEHIKLFPLEERSAVCVFITNTGHTENRTFHFDTDISLNDLNTCCEILNDRLRGTLLKDLPQRMEECKPELAQKVQKHEMLFKAFVNAFVRFASEHLYFSGQSNLLYQPEFSDIDKLKELMTLMEDESIWRDLLDGTKALATRSSEGTDVAWMDNVAVVSSTFTVNDDEQGRLMVVGPPRMDYDKVSTLLDLVASYIEKVYGKGDSRG